MTANEYMKKIKDNLDSVEQNLEQIQCDDAISRQAVLKIIDGWHENNRDNENIEDLIVLITYMSSVNPQEPKTGHWIPVSEKLPKVEQYTLITVYNQTKMCWYQNGVFVDGEQNAYTKEDKELVAWMPLPTPYEPQESEG